MVWIQSDKRFLAHPHIHLLGGGKKSKGVKTPATLIVLYCCIMFQHVAWNTLQTTFENGMYKDEKNTKKY